MAAYPEVMLPSTYTPEDLRELAGSTHMGAPPPAYV
jgi:hypothetical protein